MPDAPSSATALTVAATPAVTPWDAFLDRFGVATVVAMLAAILSICIVQNSGITPSPNMASFQLLLALIVVGCVGVLAFRSADA